MRTSLLKTLASSTTRPGGDSGRVRAEIETRHGDVPPSHRRKRRGQEPLVARFGGIPLKRQEKAVIVDRIPERVTYPRKELPMRLRKGE